MTMTTKFFPSVLRLLFSRHGVYSDNTKVSGLLILLKEQLSTSGANTDPQPNVSKTHDRPLYKTAVIREKYGIAKTNKQLFSKLQYIEEKAEIPLHTTILGIDLKKADILTVQLNSETLAMIAERYPSEEWIHVYTDGSQKSEACSAGFFSLSCARLNSC
ncbi:hypothetical protein CEXT_632661 [Caerostris extrusa]|uniref:Uncharacterized protein n=1 Tax=Caerostris extrusa TaxID=172846 RepID=A0AAV4VSI6_CAEEX|nr:hypothetical protein CEXT_632661 [Caerostris extrusa]